MNQSFWIGVYPGLGAAAIACMVGIFHKAICDLTQET
jgi:hypothetical protein